ncbi:P-loop NTPase fold protein [Saccharopolyspora elongata]|uniref:P-loop NTPase fold protein n=1 Tax=Saccharopolyspora elongata TaxID=2530387 RepID=UPI001405511B|nr:P-loop NTPase fold protein [Saccharopolyspora elongata]
MALTEAVTTRFVVLNDQPVETGEDDLLDAAATARALVELISDSHVSTPFTVAIDAGWGMGKSSLMRLMRARLEERGTPTAWFNAWTSGADALEVLIKSVLLTFDRNIVRRAYHRLAKRRRAVRFVRLLLKVVLRFFGVHRLVDELWRQLSVDAKSRNEIRDVVHDMAKDWADGGDSDGRQLVVFIDDLDRCSGDVVLAVCEAIKLYLDVPGLVFVIGCDQAVLARNMQESGGSAGHALGHLEKIVQVYYRTPAPDQESVRRLIDGFAGRSGTKELFGDGVTALIAQRTRRNPRRIKRLINSFVLEYHLNRDWQRFGASALVRVILLQHFYPEFYRSLTGTGDRDIVSEFLAYTSVREHCKAGNHPGDDEFFTNHQVAPPPARADHDVLLSSLDRVEQELPVFFPELAANPDFVSLIGELAQEADFDELRRYLQQGRRGSFSLPSLLTDDEFPQAFLLNRPTESLDALISPESWASRHDLWRLVDELRHHHDPRSLHDLLRQGIDLVRVPAPEETDASPGLRVLWVDDSFKPDLLGDAKLDLIADADRRGIRVLRTNDPESLKDNLRRFEPDLLISDITRDGDPNAGLDDLAALRSDGIYDGPAIFYTSRVTPSRVKRAEELGALGVTADPRELMSWIERFVADRTDGHDSAQD